MTTSIIEIVQREHKEIDHLIERVMNVNIHGDSQMAQDAFDELKMSLIVHARCEERVLYPQIEALKDLHRFADQSYEDHAEVEDLLNEIESTPVEDPRWKDLVLRVKHAVEAHVRIEEDEILAVLTDYFLPEELELMGDEYLKVQASVEQVEGLKSSVRGVARQVRQQMGRLFRMGT